MQIVVIAGGITQTEFQDKQIPAGVIVQFVTTIAEAKTDSAVYFYLLEEEDFIRDVKQIASLPSLVFVHAVSTTLKNLPANCVRICGWRGFLLQETIEICTGEKNIEAASKILLGLHWGYQQVPDILGLVAPRTTALLINEAYLIAGNDVHQKQQIDTAIKLAANFTTGPFELAEKIGLLKIFNLLEHLTIEDKRYSPAPLLKKEISNLGATS
jgi:3-hydroxybutyryl-CoA dehydrogenase